MFRAANKVTYHGFYDRVEYDEDFEYEGMEDYIDEARQLKLQYDQHLAQLMNHRQIKYEVLKYNIRYYKHRKCSTSFNPILLLSFIDLVGNDIIITIINN